MIRTERLVLRPWTPEDREPFAAMNRDPAVMEHYPKVFDRDESDALAELFGGELEEDGFGLWAVEVPGVARFVGYVGLRRPSFEAHFTPAVEVGWRLAREHWGRGYATEAARGSVDDGFARLGLDEIVSFAIPANVRSIAVMERLGMSHDPADDFDHPRFPPGHRLRRHVLYRLDRPPSS